MVLAGVRDRFVLVLRLGVVFAHQALQLGEFADDFGQQIRLAQLCRALGFRHIGVNERRKLAGERDDARDALFLRAQFLVKHDLRKLRQPVFQPRLQIGVVEELGVRQACADDALVAGDDRGAVVGRLDVRHQDELVDQLGGLRIAQHEALLVGADGGADHFARDRQEGFVERAHQRHRPFHQPRHFRQQAFVLDQLIALRKGLGFGVGADDVGAACRVQHHLGVMQLRDVVVEALHLDRTGRHETVAARRVAGLNAVNREAHHVRFLGFRPEGRDDRMQRPHPGEPAVAPAHRLRPRERAHHLGHDLGNHVDGGAALLLGDGDVEVALLVGLHLGLSDRGQACRAQEAGDGLLRRPHFRTFTLFLQVRLLHRHAVHGQRQPARRRKGLGALVDEPGRHQPVGDHLAQVVGGARLHARGDFFGKQFEQEIGHCVSLTLPWRGRVGAR